MMYRIINKDENIMPRSPIYVPIIHAPNFMRHVNCLNYSTTITHLKTSFLLSQKACPLHKMKRQIPAGVMA
ncbi:hypothetical protein SDC9_92253 [bioreactor metagenome]|uniref:Uncharacterized protein n=1 Tax=bioreactor metagenome TaxID=1076179 RepID=A0A644ZXB4_9ZZZZ